MSARGRLSSAQSASPLVLVCGAMSDHRRALGLLIAVLAGWSVIAAPAGARTLHVDPSSKGGPCSDSRSVAQAARASSPWCTLKRALNKAPAGSTLDLRGGTHRAVEPVDVPGRPSKLTLLGRAGEKPVVQGVRLTRCSRMKFRRLRLQYLRIERCNGSTIVDNDVTGGGLWVFFSKDVRVIDNRIHDSNEGLVLRFTERVTVHHNDFRHIPTAQRAGPGGDGIQATSVKQLMIRDNVFAEFRSAHPHVDSMEFVNSNDQVTLEGNRFHQVRGPILVPHVIGLKFSNTRWKIINNEFTNMAQWALQLINVPGALIAHNTAWFSGHGIRISGETANVTMVNNVTDFAEAGAGMVRHSAGNVIGKLVGGYRPGPADVVGAPTFIDAKVFNYQLAPESLGINAGMANVGPALDRLRRPRVGAPDAGAYEHQGG